MFGFVECFCLTVCLIYLSLLLYPSSLSQQVNKLLLGDCLYKDQRCLSPWASLFIWAVLQSRSEMAVYFWEMVQAPL